MNVELAMQALADAKAHPENLNLETFFDLPADGITKDTENFPPPCGTTACYAGFVSLRAAPIGTRIIPTDYGSRVRVPGENPVHVEIHAAAALEITGEQADVLFYRDTLTEIEAVLRYLADNPDASYDSLSDLVLDL